MRDFVKKCGQEKYLIALLGVYDKEEDFDFCVLPDKFVLKCNHGSGSVICCRDKLELDLEEARAKLNAWLHDDYAKLHAEPSYVGIVPKIVCEELLQITDCYPPKD